MEKSRASLVIILIVAVIAGVSLGFWYWQKLQFKEQPDEIPSFEEIDFQEGPGGDFPLSIEESSGGVILNWPPENMKVIQVRVFDLGEAGDMKDHQLAFFTSNFEVEEEDIAVFIPETLERNSPSSQFSVPEEFPEPENFLLPPYRVGEIPQGFYDNGYSGSEFSFEKDGRYLIEVMGVRNGTRVLAEYLLIFKGKTE
jgi:hypothetical protein